MSDNTPAAVAQRLAIAWNSGEIEPFLDLFAPGIVFESDETWPESDSYEGRDALRGFATEFRSVWDKVELEMLESFPGEDVVVARCEWVTRGRASGVEGRLEFFITLWVEDGLITRGQFFTELDEALRAAGIA